MKSIRHLSMLIYLLIYTVFMQNIDAITAGPNPVEIISVKSNIKPHPAYTVESCPIVEPPIDMDNSTRLHLKKFRIEAGKLYNKYPGSFIIMLPTKSKKIALTFDDGPDSHTTPQILDILEGHDTVATFFVVGQNVDKYPEVFERIIKDGHQLANHSWSHSRPTSITTAELINEVEKTQRKIHLKGVDTKLFRPPYGLITHQQMHELKALGYTVVIWSIDSMDWYTSNPEDISDCVIKSIHPGAIILMHCTGGYNNRQATIKALPNIISTLKKEGYEFVTVNQLLNP